MDGTIEQLHHVAHVVADMRDASELYTRLGFSVPPPSYYQLTGADGPGAFLGAANTHLTFGDNFVELITCVGEGAAVPPDAKVTQVAAPPEHLEHITAALKSAGDLIASFLARFEGVHILALHTLDVAAAAERLSAAGVQHGGVSVAQRQVDTPDGPQLVATRFLEIDGGDPARPNLVPEGRIAVAESIAAELAHGASHLTHDNGATRLVESILCVSGGELESYEARYGAYLDRAARTDGDARVFDLPRGRVTLMADTRLASVLPGETAAAVPGFVGFFCAVADVDATRSLLKERGFPVVDAPAGGIFVPASAASGAAVGFVADEADWHSLTV
jgi:hypothetical protein